MTKTSCIGVYKLCYHQRHQPLLYTSCIDSCYSSFCILNDNFFKNILIPTKLRNFYSTTHVGNNSSDPVFTAHRIIHQYQNSFLLLSKTNLPKDLDELHLGSITTKISYWQLKLPLHMANFEV